MARRKRPIGDRHDARGALVGVVVFLVLGAFFALATDVGARGWLYAFVFATGVTNIASFTMRKRHRAAAEGRTPRR
jgi:hypothetical protein